MPPCLHYRRGRVAARAQWAVGVIALLRVVSSCHARWCHRVGRCATPGWCHRVGRFVAPAVSSRWCSECHCPLGVAGHAHSRRASGGGLGCLGARTGPERPPQGAGPKSQTLVKSPRADQREQYREPSTGHSDKTRRSSFNYSAQRARQMIATSPDGSGCVPLVTLNSSLVVTRRCGRRACAARDRPSPVAGAPCVPCCSVSEII